MTGNANRYLVSAIVSTYKAERFLRGKLEDLEAQTIADRLEIIVIDSASPENERGIVAEFQERYDNIRYLRTEKRETVYQAWNRGIQMATGEFVTNANTDDRLRSDAYETLVRALRQRPDCVLAYPDMRITEAENGSFDNHESLGFRDWPEFDRLNLMELCCVGPFPLWRRSLHEKIGYFDERFRSAADYEFWLRAALTENFVHVPEFLGLYLLSPETVSRKGDLPTLEYLEVQKEYRPRYAPLTPAPQDLSPADRDLFGTLAARLEAGDPAVLPELEDFAKLHPRAPGPHAELAEIYYKKGEIGYAKKHFEKAALIAPESAEHRERLAAFLKSELYQALQHQTAEACANPDDLECRLCAGMTLILLERHEAARGHYLRALEIDPDSSIARENLRFLEGRRQDDGPCDYYRFPRPEVLRAVSRRSRFVLDVGCGAGELAASIGRRQGAEVWGIEPDAKAAAAAAKVLHRVLPLPIEEALSQLPERRFQTIVLADVLEHLVDPERVLQDLAGKLSHCGEAIVSLPNVRHRSVIEGLLRGSWEYEEAGILDRTHLRFFTRKSALALFERAGFAVTGVDPIRLKGEDGIPAGLAEALRAGGLADETLEEESAAYQYLFRLVRKDALLTSIVILTWNELDCTRACLESLERNTPEPHEVILVDNGSTDGTLPYLREFCGQRSGYRLIENGENLGFAAGCNIGMRQARGGRILLLNNDTVLTRGWLSGLIDALEREPLGGIVGPMTNEIAGVQKIAAPRYESVAELEAFAASFRNANYGRRIPTDRVVGFCMLFTRDLLAEIGELDTLFGSGNYEDDDFCLRAALKGYRSIVAADVFIHHEGSRTFTGNRVDYRAAMAKNRRAFDAKWDIASLEPELAARLVSHNAVVRGERLARQGRGSEAVDLLLQEGIRFSPASPAPYLALARVLVEAGSHKDALEVLERAPQGEELAVTLLMGRCHRGLGDSEQALALAERALALDPEAPGALQLKGALLFEGGEVEEAKELLRRAIAADPGFGPAYATLAELHSHRGEKEKALELAELSFVLSPLELEALGRYHDLATEHQKLSREEERLDQALALYPEHKGLRYALIELLIRAGRYREAIGEIERAAARFGLDEAGIDAALEIRGLAGEPEPTRRGEGGVSVCMIVKDEAKNLAGALYSVRGLAGELVVVDTGSCDRTRDIARIFGARLISFPWNGNFSDARNVSLDQAQGDWILVLDADERLAAEDLSPLAGLLARTTRPTAFSFTTRNYTEEIARRDWTGNAGEYPAEERGRGWTPSDKVRLVPNDARIRFQGAVHELLEDSLLACGIPIHACDVPVHHYGKLDADRCREKQEEYYLLGLKKLSETGASIEALTELARQATELNRAEEAIGLWHRLLQAHPENAEAYLNLGYLHLASGNYPQARADAKRGVELAPGMKEAAFNLAKCDLYLGDTKGALEGCRKLLDSCPDYPPALSLLSVCLLLEGSRADATQLMRKLCAMRFDCADFLNEYAAGLSRGERGDLAAPLTALAETFATGGTA